MRPSELAELIAAAYTAADHPEVESVAVRRTDASLTVNTKFADGSAAHHMLAFRAEGPGGKALPHKDHELPKEKW
jgi:hypothetical protein